MNPNWPSRKSTTFHFVAEEKKKKKDDKITKAFYDWATTGIPVMTSSTRKQYPNAVIGARYSNAII